MNNTELIKAVNEALKNVSQLRYRHEKFKKVANEKIINIKDEEGEQGESDEITEIYSLGVEDYHLKIVLLTDSYGDNPAINSIQVVRPKEQIVQIFETI